MGALYIEFSDADAAESFVNETGGFEYVPGAHVLEAVYGDDRIDGPDDDFGVREMRVMPRRGVGGSPAVLRASDDMPKPWPSIIGYDGMPPYYAGVAMKACSGRWVPVARFDPPFSDEDQAAINARAESAYADRCAEYAVNGAVR